MSQAMELKRADELPLAPAASESAAILSVIERMAMNPDIDPERIERFIVLKERMDLAAAEKAFNAAITAAKAEIQPIVRTEKGHNGKYADLAAIANAVDPILSAHGLHYRHKTAQSEKGVTVTCILSHELGHKEETSITAGADTSGNKNSIQAIGSTQTYLMRYTLVSALGLSTVKDDDGKAAGIGETITDDQVNALRDLIEEVGADLPKFCAYVRVESLSDIRQSDFKRAVTALEAKRQPK